MGACLVFVALSAALSAAGSHSRLADAVGRPSRPAVRRDWQGARRSAEDRLPSAASGALLWSYTYALACPPPAGLTHFVRDRLGNVIAESNGTGPAGTLREYIWLPEAEFAPTFQSRSTDHRPLAMIVDVETASPLLWYVHVDHLHQPIKMTNAAEASVWDAVSCRRRASKKRALGHVAFDHRLRRHSVLPARLRQDARFPGQWFQLEAGLHYNWHRHYDPSIGRYRQPDPLGFVDGPSVYGYARGSSGMMVDPDGRALPILIPIIIGAGIGILTDLLISELKAQCRRLNCRSSPTKQR